MLLLTKLKYAGLSRQKLINIYCLFIRSSAEYCSVVWHENLTIAQSNLIERVQIVALKIIAGQDCPRKEDGHCNYEELLKLCNLTSLFDRRNKRMLSFGQKCIRHPTLSHIFPLSTEDIHNIQNHEVFHMNYARTSAYRNSAIPAIQRRLNQHYSPSHPHLNTCSLSLQLVLHTMIVSSEANVFGIDNKTAYYNTGCTQHFSKVHFRLQFAL